MQFLSGSKPGDQAKFVIDPSKQPGQIEVVYAAGPFHGKRRIGIYKLDSDTLQLSLSEPGGDRRPTTFGDTTPPGKGPVSFTFRRVQE
jgi:uncharacterized protein (TIGR03067 family)